MPLSNHRVFAPKLTPLHIPEGLVASSRCANILFGQETRQQFVCELQTNWHIRSPVNTDTGSSLTPTHFKKKKKTSEVVWMFEHNVCDEVFNPKTPCDILNICVFCNSVIHVVCRWSLDVLDTIFTHLSKLNTYTHNIQYFFVKLWLIWTFDKRFNGFGVTWPLLLDSQWKLNWFESLFWKSTKISMWVWIK